MNLPVWIHAEETCEKPCPFHEPSDHPMRDWPITLRASGLVERRCHHVGDDGYGCGHPDPDSLAYLRRHDPEGSAGLGIHGCDGCCTGSYPLPDAIGPDFDPDELAQGGGCLSALLRLVLFRRPSESSR